MDKSQKRTKIPSPTACLPKRETDCKGEEIHKAKKQNKTEVRQIDHEDSAMTVALPVSGLATRHLENTTSRIPAAHWAYGTSALTTSGPSTLMFSLVMVRHSWSAKNEFDISNLHFLTQIYEL
jgi:hypothetical protein